MVWKPWLGAVPDARGTHFRVWAPRTPALEVRVEGGPEVALARDEHGYFTGYVAGVQAGARYRYRFPDGRERPDPASLLQPEGVHGPSEVVDLQALAPRRAAPGTPLEQLVFCEIHLGTFSEPGTADGAAQRLASLADAGYTAVEVMPVAAFPGARNWGYDGVAPFAAHHDYGGPAGLSRFVDKAHEAGLRAFLDVVYNHLGPEGNYLSDYAPYFTSAQKTPWGDALDFSAPPVRRFFLENALRWVASAGAAFDGLRLDAIHGIIDDSPKHVLHELADLVRAEAVATGRSIHVIAESDLNDPAIVEIWGLDGSWADDLHHGLHVALTGESQGYYGDFAPPAADPMETIVNSLRAGWHYAGQHKPSFGRPHGTKAGHLRARHFVVCAQNHDQIGNRARGERLCALVDVGGVRVAAAVIALQPALPLYFQGEEWSAPEPFLYFTSHCDPALAEAVRRGRREEFKAFTWQGEVPDPQSEETFAKSKLDWSHRDEPEGQASLRWHRALLSLRREQPALQDDARESLTAEAIGRTLLLRRRNAGLELLLVAGFAEGEVSVPLPAGKWKVVLDSGSPRFSPGREAQLSAGALQLHGRHAVVLRPG